MKKNKSYNKSSMWSCMNKINKLLIYIEEFSFIIFSCISIAFFINRVFVNVTLLLDSQVIIANIKDVKYTNSRRSHYCTLYFEYENEGIKYNNKAEYDLLLIDRISNLIAPEYRIGDKILIAHDNYGNFQVRHRIKTELFISSLYFLLSIALLIFAVYTFLSEINGKRNNNNHTDGQNSK